MVIEQLIGAQGHDIIGYTPRRGQAAAWSMAALLAHGAHGLLFFRYRPALFGQEEYCYGVLDHSGEKGNKYFEAKELFHSATLHKHIIQSRVQARVALLYDMESAYIWQAQPQSILFDFSTENHRLYYPFWRNGVAMDVLSLPHLLEQLRTQQDPAAAAARLFEQYKVLLFPVAAVVGGPHNGETAMALLETFVQLGGSVWVSFRSDLKDQRSQIRPKRSRLAHLAGVKISEIEALNDASAPAPLVSPTDPETATTASVFREGLEPMADIDDVEVLFNYNDSFFGGEGYAAVTRRIIHPEEKVDFNGEVVYIGCGIEPEALVQFAADTVSIRGVVNKEGFQKISTTGIAESNMVEQVIREDEKGNKWRIAINHDEVTHTASDGTILKPYQLHVNRERI
jgi:beta-galactosidase